VSNLSLWYIRRSRDRVGPNVKDSKDKESFYYTSYNVLIRLSALLAPFTPFIADEIFTNLSGERSVHLTGWPGEKDNKHLKEISNKNKKLVYWMELIRKVVELGHSQRKEKGVAVRQPLAEITVIYTQKPPKELLKLVEDEN
jgi:isoleucyl-tRNA synthetase